MAEKRRWLTIVAEIATVISTACTLFLVYMARHPPSANATGHAQGGGLVVSPVLLGAVTLGACTLIAGILNFRASRRPADSSTLASIPPDPYAGVLSSLQLDALRLAGELLAYVKTLDPQPADMAVVDWRRIVRAKYALRFKPTVVEIYRRFTEIGLSEHHFASLVDSADSPEDMQELAKILRERAFLAFDVAVS